MLSRARLLVAVLALGVTQPVTAHVPKNTPIVVQTYNAINSATFQTGERLAYTVVDDVIVNGTIIARAGDKARGVVQNAQQGKNVRAGRAGMLFGPVAHAAGAAADKAASKGSNLRVSVTRVDTFCGGRIDLSFVRSEYHKPKRFGKTTSVEIAKGQKYVAMVAHDTTTCGIATTRTPAPIPGDALHADPSSNP
jgi:hypothetical protein